MNKLFKSLAILAIFTAMFCTVMKVPVKAETETPVDVIVTVDGGEALNAHGLYVGYDDNLYVSLIDLQKLVKGTAKEFKFNIADGIINIYKDYDAAPDVSESGRELTGWSDGQKADFANKALAANGIFLNEEERKYYTVVTSVGGSRDCFIHISDFCVLLNVNASFDGNEISINTSEDMAPINPLELESIGFFQSVNSVLVGDATTGEVFYGYHSDEVYPIASTTKLMTYLIMADAIAAGKVTYDDMVTVSKVAQDISVTSDGLIPMKEGQSFPMWEMINAALIISSNECDHAVSEYVAGSEEAAVKLMNDKAQELSMTTAQFYNCNGLPIYTKSLFPAKKQNRMSSEDMFKLASHILNTYPQVKEITSTKYAKMEALNKELKNTNPVLYNMPEATGMKTGTTNKSGACLVTSLVVNDGNMDHDLVVVEFGAESAPDRGRVSELMARYAKAVVLGSASKVDGKVVESESTELTANNIVNMIVNKAMQMKQ